MRRNFGEEVSSSKRRLDAHTLFSCSLTRIHPKMKTRTKQFPPQAEDAAQSEKGHLWMDTNYDDDGESNIHNPSAMNKAPAPIFT